MFPAHAVEIEDEERVDTITDADPPEVEFSDVELLLSEHTAGGLDGGSAEAFLETEVAEVLEGEAGRAVSPSEDEKVHCCQGCEEKFPN